MMHGGSKHIDVRFHFLRELSNFGCSELKFCPSQNQLADILTKGMKIESFIKLKREIRMCSTSEVEEDKQNIHHVSG